MRRVAPLIVLGLGIFLIVLSGLVKFVVAPAAVKAPLTIPTKYQKILASGQNFKFANPHTGQQDTVTVNITRTVQGDAASGDGKVAVYVESLCLTVDDGSHPGCVDKTDPRLITITTDRIAFDRKTGMAVDNPKYKANVDGDTSIKHVGLGYKFPIDTKKKTYQYFDTVVGKPFPAVYTDTEKLNGLTVYKFVQKMENQNVYTNGVLPSTYTDTRTMWVEPTTGVIVKGSEDLTQTLTGRASLDPNSALRDPGFQNVVALQGLLVFTDATVANQAQLAKDNLGKIHLIRLWIPLIALVLGLILLVLSIPMLRRPASRNTEPPAPAASEPPLERV
jgi:hypothetical protein